MKPAELAAWVRAMEAKGAERFTLRHLVWTDGGGESLAMVNAWPAGDDAAELARGALAAASEDAADTGGAQRYGLCAEGPDAAPLGRKVWRVLGARYSEEGSLSEPPTTVGQISMLMRHTEAKERTALMMVPKVLEQYAALIDRYAADVERYQAREVQMLELRERLMSAEHERTLALREQEEKLALRSRALEKLEPLWPMLAAKVFKTPLAPGDQASSALDALLSSISTDQADRLATVFSPEQLIALQELYKEGAERQAKRDAAKAAAKPAAGPVNGAAS